MRHAFEEFRDYQVTDAFSALEPETDDDSQAEQVGKDKEAWKKAEEYLTQLQDDEHMLTLEDTDVAIERAEQYLHRSDGAGAAVKDKVAFKADVATQRLPTPSSLPWKRKSRLCKHSCAEIQQEQSVAAMVYQCRRRLSRANGRLRLPCACQQVFCVAVPR